MAKPRFFDKQDEQNQIKTTLVTKYFSAWAKIMLNQRRPSAHDDRIAYTDLFSGPGRFEDNRPSTPILILEQALADPRLSQRLVTLFNDKDLGHVEQLRAEIASLPGIDALRNRPRVMHLTVDRDAVEALQATAHIPTLFFFDPFGYKGLSLGLIREAIKSWGCDCIFFFNYNRLNPAATNDIVASLIDDFFGPVRAEELRRRLPGLDPVARESTILQSLSAALAEVGGKHSLAFRFRSTVGTRTSHYIVFVTKHFRGYDIMKDIMSGESSDDGEVKRFEYVPVKRSQLALFSDPDDPYSIPTLKRYIQTKFQGMRLLVLEACEKGSIDTPYTSKNVKEALLELESEGYVIVDKPASERRVIRGKVTLSDDRQVTFTR